MTKDNILFSLELMWLMPQDLDGCPSFVIEIKSLIPVSEESSFNKEMQLITILKNVIGNGVESLSFWPCKRIMKIIFKGIYKYCVYQDFLKLYYLYLNLNFQLKFLSFYNEKYDNSRRQFLKESICLY